MGIYGHIYGAAVVQSNAGYVYPFVWVFRLRSYILPPFGAITVIADGIHLVSCPYIWQTVGNAPFPHPGQPQCTETLLVCRIPKPGETAGFETLLKSIVKSLFQRHQRELDM